MLEVFQIISIEFHFFFKVLLFFVNTGVIQAYRRCLPLVQFFGPTNFAPVIKHVTRFAAAYTNGVHYFILLILTDGAISDMHDTKRVNKRFMRFSFASLFTAL